MTTQASVPNESVPEEEVLAPLITVEFQSLAERLASSPPHAWDAPSLCEGWRTREVVAHLTMPARYTTKQFMAQLQECGFDFTLLSNTVAQRDGQLPVSTLLDDLGSGDLHAWRPPGGGPLGALLHVVAHAIDITAIADTEPAITDTAAMIVLDNLASGGHANFGVDVGGRRLEAHDLDWSFGDGSPLSGYATDLIAALAGRTPPPGRLTGDPLTRGR